MMSVNLMFHISSALAFLLLIYLLLRQEQRLRFHAELWAALAGGKTRKPVLVDWPQRFFERLCQAWQVPFSWPAGHREATAQKIDPAVWVACHAALGIRAIEGQEGLRLRVLVNRPDLAGEWPTALARALGGRFTVELWPFEAKKSQG